MREETPLNGKEAESVDVDKIKKELEVTDYKDMHDFVSWKTRRYNTLKKSVENAIDKFNKEARGRAVSPRMEMVVDGECVYGTFVDEDILGRDDFIFFAKHFEGLLVEEMVVEKHNAYWGIRYVKDQETGRWEQTATRKEEER